MTYDMNRESYQKQILVITKVAILIILVVYFLGIYFAVSVIEVDTDTDQKLTTDDRE